MHFEKLFMLMGIIVIAGAVILYAGQEPVPNLGQATQTVQEINTRVFHVGGAQYSSGELTYTHTNYLGSPIKKTNQQGEIIQTINYNPYGKSNNEKTDYTGKIKQASTGYVNLGAREYDPNTRRFLVPDPVLEPGASPYVYAANNPLSYIDPDGRSAVAVVETVYIGLNALKMAPHPALKAVAYAGLAGANFGLFLTSITVERDPSEGIFVTPPSYMYDGPLITPIPDIQGADVFVYPAHNIENEPLVTPEMRTDFRDSIMTTGKTFVEKLGLDESDRMNLIMGEKVEVTEINFGVQGLLSEVEGTVSMTDDKYIISIGGAYNDLEDGSLMRQLTRTILSAAKAANAEGRDLEVQGSMVKNPHLWSFLESKGFEKTKSYNVFGEEWREYSRTFSAE